MRWQQLSFDDVLEQATGIEPAAQPWEGWVLPLYDACIPYYFIEKDIKKIEIHKPFDYEKN